MVDKCNSVDKLLNGGLVVNLDLNDQPIVMYMVSNCGNIEDYTIDGTVTRKKLSCHKNENKLEDLFKAIGNCQLDTSIPEQNILSIFAP